jgi:peptidoglycan hydrolase-like protein with peptidoglycan-binding domain
MSYSLNWLASVLREAGLKVAEVDGWKSRGRREFGPFAGVICHHTAVKAGGNMPTLGTLINGRSDLAGPLSQLGLGRDGTFYVVAAGRANHAGSGNWHGITDANQNYVGIEAENAGDGSELWPEVQLDAYRRGVAALLAHMGKGAECCIGHKEYAPHRKVDPNFDMEQFRADVRGVMAGQTQVGELIPAKETNLAPNQTVLRPTLRRLGSGNAVWVSYLQSKLGLEADGNFGPQTEAAVRAMQRSANLVPDGIVGPKSWVAVDAL